MPTVLSNSSTPPYWLRFHFPPLSAWLAGAMLRAVASSGGDVGCRGVHDHDAGNRCCPDIHVVQTDPGTGDDLEPCCGSQRLLVDLGGGADQHGIDVCQCRQQLGAVGAIAVPDLEVRPEGIQRCG
jgi:hypothetical protein